MNGASFGDGLLAGLKGAGLGAAIGGMFGGISKGIDAVKNGKANFWDGHVDIDLSNGYGANLNGKPVMKLIRAIYTGHKFYGTNIYESSSLGNATKGSGITLPEYGIVVGKGVYDAYLANYSWITLLQHEYGHVLDYNTMLVDANGIESIALNRYYSEVGLPSLKSAIFNSIETHSVQSFEVRANILAKSYFGNSYVSSPKFPTAYQIQGNSFSVFSLPNIEMSIKNYIINNCVPF